MSDNRFFFSDLEIAPGFLVSEGYAVIGAGLNIEEIYAGFSESNLIPVSDPGLFRCAAEALDREHAEDIAAMFGPDLNAGLRLGARQYGIGRAA